MKPLSFYQEYDTVMGMLAHHLCHILWVRIKLYAPSAFKGRGLHKAMGLRVVLGMGILPTTNGVVRMGWDIQAESHSSDRLIQLSSFINEETVVQIGRRNGFWFIPHMVTKAS